MDRADLLTALERSPDLPKIPAGISRLFGMLVSEEEVASPAELTRAVEQIDRLPPILLQVINSRTWELSQTIDNVAGAIVLLGSNTVANLLLALITKATLPKASGKTRHFDREKYWRHCVGTAIAAEYLARKQGSEDPFRWFSWGLVHDLGIALFDACAPALLQRSFELYRQGNPRLAAERHACGATHGEVGAWFGGRIGLPQDTCNAIEHHETPFRAPQDRAALEVLWLGDQLSTMYYERLLGISRKYDGGLWASLDWIDSHAIQLLAQELPTKVDNAVELLALDALALPSIVG